MTWLSLAKVIENTSVTREKTLNAYDSKKMAFLSPVLLPRQKVLTKNIFSMGLFIPHDWMSNKLELKKAKIN